MTDDPCYLKAHYDLAVIHEALDTLNAVDQFDVKQCRTCKRWYVVRRPDWNDAS